MSGKTIWLARHGNRIDFVDPQWSVRHGHDPHLSPDGVEQARLTGERLRGEGIRRILASPFLRTLETAYHIAEALEVPICVEHALSEYYNADWFGPSRPVLLDSGAVMNRFPRVDVTYRSLPIPSFPETIADVFARTRELAIKLEAMPDTVLAVSHGAAISGLELSLLGQKEAAKHPLCSISKLVQNPDGTWKSLIQGDCTHLKHLVSVEKRFH